MADTFTLLVREVERLVTAPYAPSLQNLHDVIQKSPTALISSWALCKPCQVGALIDVLVDGLSRSRVALPLLCAFTPVTTVRNVLLERYPALLDHFLQKAVEDGEREYFSACSAMLSSSLPPNFVAPACLANFITKLVSGMAENPCEETILPLYQLMTGLQTSPGLLYDVPSDTMSTLHKELTKILRSLDDRMGFLLCLATFARIASSQQYDTIENEHVLETPSWKLGTSHLFGPKRGFKTVELIVLRVIYACSSSCELTPRKAAENIRLAIEICDSIGADQKHLWITADKFKITMLCEKLIRDGISPEVQMMGLAFLVSLLPATKLAPEILALGLQGLLSHDSKRVLEIIPHDLIPRLVEAIAISSGKPAISSLLNYVFSTLKNSSIFSHDNMMKVQISDSIICGLRLRPQPYARSILEVEGKETVAELLEIFPLQSTQIRCEASSICDIAFHTSQNQLFSDLLTLCTGKCSSGNTNNTKEGVADSTETLVLGFFINQFQKALPQKHCSFSNSRPFDIRDSLTSLHIGEGPWNSSGRRDWRSGIAETLMHNARTSHEIMMSKVEEICQDLEHRCYDTEGPLRIVEQERDQLSAETERLKNHNEELEVRLQQASNNILNLQQNISQLEQDVEAASAHAEELSASLDLARRELEEERYNSKETSQNEREKSRSKELDLIAAMTEKDEHIEELNNELLRHGEENKEMRQFLDEVSKENVVCLEESARLKQKIIKIEEAAEANQMVVDQKNDEIKRMLADKESMRADMDTLRQKVEEEMVESERGRAALREVEENFRAETDSLRKQNESELSQVVSECVKQKEENKALQTSMHVAASNATKELQTKDKRIQNLEKKVQSMRDERAAKAREFSEAQQHIGRLMTVMGFKADPTDTPVPTRHQRTGSTLGSSPATIRRKANAGDDYEAPTPNQPQDTLDESFEPNTPCSTGRSPKRSKGNPWVLDTSPSVHTAGNRKSKDMSSQGHARQHRERNPLGNADDNSQPSSQRSRGSRHSQTGASQESQTHINPDENRLNEIDLNMDLEFSKDFLFTGTSMSETNNQTFTQGTQP